MPKTELVGGHKLSMSNEDYLESIYRITIEQDGQDDGIKSVEVADQLGVSKASVNKALATLKDAGMVEQTRYGRVKLTDEGRRYGSLVWRSHRTLRSFLIGDLGVDPEVADREACLIEHYLSEDTVDRLVSYLHKQGLVIEG